jgi:hypothetical protein
MDLHKYYQENKDNINSSIMEIASDLATARLIMKYNQSFEAFQQPQDPNNPDNNCTCFKEEYQDEFNQLYDKEYDRIAKLMKFDYNTEDGQMESKATEVKTAYATVRYDIENINGEPISDEDIDDVLDELWNDTKIVGDYIVVTQICQRNDENVF